MDTIIWQLCGGEQMALACITAHLQSVYGRGKTLQSLAGIRGACPATVKEIEAFFGGLTDLDQAERDIQDKIRDFRSLARKLFAELRALPEESRPKLRRIIQVDPLQPNPTN
jgi:hypothetical protein